MLRVLDTTDANGSAFTTSLFSGSERTYLQAICDTHAGGTWTLQARVPGGAWVDTDTTFAAAGLARWAAADDFTLSLSRRNHRRAHHGCCRVVPEIGSGIDRQNRAGRVGAGRRRYVGQTCRYLQCKSPAGVLFREAGKEPRESVDEQYEPSPR